MSYVRRLVRDSDEQYYYWIMTSYYLKRFACVRVIYAFLGQFIAVVLNVERQIDTMRTVRIIYVVKMRVYVDK